jgi:hypothetical protein
LVVWLPLLLEQRKARHRPAAKGVSLLSSCFTR